MKKMKRLKPFCIAKVSVTLVTLALVTSGLEAAAGYHLIYKETANER
jgi:hypothetical protein